MRQTFFSDDLKSHRFWSVEQRRTGTAKWPILPKAYIWGWPHNSNSLDQHLTTKWKFQPFGQTLFMILQFSSAGVIIIKTQNAYIEFLTRTRFSKVWVQQNDIIRAKLEKQTRVRFWDMKYWLGGKILPRFLQETRKSIYQNPAVPPLDQRTHSQSMQNAWSLKMKKTRTEKPRTGGSRLIDPPKKGKEKWH